MKRHMKYLIIRGDGSARITTRYPGRLRVDEIAYKLYINVPDAWGRIMNDKIELTLPDAPPTVERVETV